jgi:hypothetical protein
VVREAGAMQRKEKLRFGTSGTALRAEFLSGRENSIAPAHSMPVRDVGIGPMEGVTFLRRLRQLSLSSSCFGIHQSLGPRIAVSLVVSPRRQVSKVSEGLQGLGTTTSGTSGRP